MDNLPAWLHGLFAVLPTPMRGDGELDLESLDRVVDYYLDGGATGLVPASVAGEGDRLDEGERLRVMRRVVQRCRGRAPMVAGVLATDIDCALAQARAAVDCGAAAVLVKPPMDGAQAVLEHFCALGQHLRLPIILLDYPPAGPRLPVELIGALVEKIPEVCGIKLEDEPTAEKMARLRMLVGSRLRILGGLSGAHCLSELQHGADGFFTGCPHPHLLVKAMEAFRLGDLAGVTAAVDTLGPVISLERRHPGAMIGRRKLILRELGIILEAVTRAPSPIQ